MPSHALIRWQTDRLPRLNAIDAQCDAVFSLVAPNPTLADENLRGYVMLLSAHLQGFCRDLHTECVQVVATALGVSPAVRVMIQAFGLGGRQLDGSNPRFDAIRKDFNRFGLSLSSAFQANPANVIRVTLLDHMNQWRNYAAHDKATAPSIGGPFTLATVRAWVAACDGLATELDGVMYNQLSSILGRPPW
jgi:hypothetical protein